MILTNEQREAFKQWLHAEITSDDALIEQMCKLPVPVVGIVDIRRADRDAKLRVLRILESTESWSVRG